jgi:hypothetical protein
MARSTSGKETPLMEANGALPLYEPSAMLELDAQMAQGYAILLTGAQEQSLRTKKHAGPSRQTIMLGFAAMTDGNVVEACFGVRQAHGSSASDTVKRDIKNVKNALSEAQQSDNKIALVAVTAYAQAFQVIAAFRSELDKMNFITKCFRYGGIRNNALEALQKCFAPLQEALAASN